MSENFSGKDFSMIPCDGFKIYEADLLRLSEWKGKGLWFTESSCRSCGSDRLERVLEYGATPLADVLLTEEEAGKPELAVPLTLAFCMNCCLLQILESVDPSILFGRKYPYFSSVSETLRKHFRTNADGLMETRKLGPRSLVIEAASNDGCLLRHFLERGIPVLGIDPAEGPVREARRRGIPTVQDFFSSKMADILHRRGVAADLFLANNVLAHVPDPNDFLGGVGKILKEDGMAVFEVHYVVDLIDRCEFDTVYHQHYSYFSLSALHRLFRRHDLYINDVMPLPTYGGSLRIFVEKTPSTGESVTSMLREEQRKGIESPDYYREMGTRALELKENLLRLLLSLKVDGKRIAAYGAAAKATTFLSFCGIDEKILDYVADANPFKHGLFMGGNHLPVVSPSWLTKNRPDHVLLLAWNFAGEILRQEESYVKSGGRFILPLPRLEIL